MYLSTYLDCQDQDKNTLKPKLKTEKTVDGIRVS